MITGCLFWPITFFRPPLFIWIPRLLIFRLSVGLPPLLLRPPTTPLPIIWDWKVKLQAFMLKLLKKRLLYMCFPVSFVKYFRGHFLQNTSKRLLLQNILLFFTSTTAAKCDHWPCFFPFYFKYFQSKHLSFLKVLNN